MSVVSKRGMRLAILGCSAFLAACGGSGGGGGPAPESTEVFVQSIPASQQRLIATDEARPFRSEGEYASVLKDCALASTENICTLGQLPYLGQTGQAPTIEDVMQRLLVTHDWMGVRFEQMLRRMPADIIGLFAPVTSIVIGSDVRPSSFSASLGRVRLDPGYLWLSVPEKRTISVDDDYRAEFGADLRFRSFRRMAIDDGYATPSSSIRDDNPRGIDELDISLARLLYHELAHANDFAQASALSTLPLDFTPLDAVTQLDETAVWRKLYDQEQLTVQSTFMYPLARVRYQDLEPSDDQRSMDAGFVGSEMGSHGKASFYGYYKPAEDVATLFATAMMNYHYDVDFHVGFANKPDIEGDIYCNDYKVAWGVRNRLASPLVAPRAKFVVDSMLPPSAARDQFFATGLGNAVPLRNGAGWCESVSSTQATANRSRTVSGLSVPGEIVDHEIIDHEIIDHLEQ